MVDSYTTLPLLQCMPSLSLSPRSGIPWGLASVVLSALTMILIIYLYNRKYVKGVSPHGLVLCLFGTVGGIATAVGIGGIGAYLGLGIINSMNGSGEWGCMCVCVCVS